MNFIYSLIDTILPFEWTGPLFMKNAFLAVLIACPLFGLLGTFVVSNKMAFFSDAIGHSALTGIAIGVLAGLKDPVFCMVTFSILLGGAIIWVKIRGKASSDTIIGVFSSTAVALGIVLLSATGSYARYQKYLIGDILSIQPYETVLMLGAGIAVFILFIVFYNKMLVVNLHPVFAKSRRIRTAAVETVFALATAAVVALSIRWTGLLVINSLLVLPAASSRMISRSSRSYTSFSVLISLASGITGLVASWYLGSASGAAIVLANSCLFFICFLLRR